jgi:glycosyltransferase involved in cell wall biosynthesis
MRFRGASGGGVASRVPSLATSGKTGPLKKLSGTKDRDTMPHMAHLTVSFCIPTHGRSRLLLEALESGLAQTRPPNEIVVSDDLGSAETRELVSTFANRAPFPVRYSHCTAAPCLANNMNNCLIEATSDLTLLLHDDDLLFPCAVELLAQPFEENPNLVASYGKQWFVDDTGVHSNDRDTETANRVHLRTPEYAGLQPDSTFAGLAQQFPNDGFLVKTSAARQIVYNPEFGAAAEVDFGIRLAERGQFYFVDEFTAKYRNSDDSLGRGAGAKNDDSAYFCMHILEALLKAQPQRANEILPRLRDLSPMSIQMATNTGRLDEAIAWYLGPYHQKRIASLGGIKRGLLIAMALTRRKLARAA